MGLNGTALFMHFLERHYSIFDRFFSSFFFGCFELRCAHSSQREINTWPHEGKLEKERKKTVTLFVHVSYILMTFFYHRSSWPQTIVAVTSGKYCGDSYETGLVIFDLGESTWKEWILLAAWVV